MSDYLNAKGHRVTVHGDLPKSPAMWVEFAPQGGGFLRRMRVADFIASHKPAPEPMMGPILVSGDWFTDDIAPIAAYGDGNRWNGWAMPHFDKASADALLAFSPNLSYNAVRDGYVDSTDQDVDGTLAIYEAMTIEVAGKPIKVYPIGAGSWCWDQVEGAAS